MRDSGVNEKLAELLDKADRAFEKAATLTERRLLQAYRKALDSVKAKIAAVYEDNPTPTLTEMRKFNRLTKIEDQIVEEIRRLTQVSANTTSQSIKDTFLQSYTETGEAFELGTGLNLSFSRLPKAAIEFAVSDNLWLDSLKLANAKLITDVKREFETVLRTNARQEVVQGLAQGDSYGTVAKAIQERFNVAATRARTIAFTEIHKAQSKGRVEGILRGAEAADRLGFKTVKVWKENYVGISRLEHIAADGQRVAVDQPFKVGGEELEAPGLGTDPANNINCFISSVSIVSPSEIEKVMRRFYSGPLVEITTRSGMQVTGTPNHPVLTPEGFVPLDSLDEGSDVLSADRRKDFPRLYGDVYNAPVSFGEIFDLCRVNASMKRIAGSEKDFHGDGFIGDVDVVPAKSLLRNAVKSERLHPLGEYPLALAQLGKGALLGDGAFRHLFLGALSAFDGLVCLCRDALLFLVGHPSHSQLQCCSAITARDVVHGKDALDDGATGFVARGNLKLGKTLRVLGDEFLGDSHFKGGWSRIIEKLRHFRLGSFTNSMFSEKLDQRSLADGMLVGKVLLTNAGMIGIDKVVGIRRFEFSGHVFNLQTVDGYYLVNNISIANDNGKYLIAHNCHCSAQFEVQGLE